MAKLTCLSKQQSYSIRDDLELLQAYRIDPSLPLKFGCCHGQCGTCAMKVVEGQDALSKKTQQEKETLQKKQLNESYRLACQCAIHGHVVIE